MFFLLNQCLEIILNHFVYGLGMSSWLWPITLMRTKEHTRDCNHFYIILGQHCIIRKGWFPWPQQGLKLQALPQPGFRKVTEIALASFCPCVLLRYKVSVRWQSNHRDTLQRIHQHSDGQLLCGASCFLNQRPKLQLCLNLFSMQYACNLYQPRAAVQLVILFLKKDTFLLHKGVCVG